jgi:hypothetical protein
MESKENVKILAALKEEFSKVCIFDKNGKSKTGIDYYETVIKPKYKQNQKLKIIEVKELESKIQSQTKEIEELKEIIKNQDMTINFLTSKW